MEDMVKATAVGAQITKGLHEISRVLGKSYPSTIEMQPVKGGAIVMMTVDIPNATEISPRLVQKMRGTPEEIKRWILPALEEIIAAA